MTPFTVLAIFTNGAFTIFLLNNYFCAKYPEDYNRFLMNVVYYCVYTFSKIQHTTNKYIIEPITMFLNQYATTYNYSNIHFIFENEIVCITNTNRLFQDIPYLYDFIIYINKTDNHTLKKIIQFIPNNHKFICEESNIKFILVEIQFNNTTIKIDFKPNSRDNYYVVDNIFDATFIRYLLATYYAVYDVPDEYKLTILDHSVNRIEVDEKKSIRIKKDGYSII
jgi:hypothetical protein